MRQKRNKKLFRGSKLCVNLKTVAKHNKFFRNVVYTSNSMQIVAARVPPGAEIGYNEPRHTDLVLFILTGTGKLIVNSKERVLKRQDILFFPAKSPCKLKNCSEEQLKLLAIYTPPEYLDGTIRKTEKDALAAAHEAMRHAWEQ
jgi:mannose-6-phosphate isomerase-like protein (cupin superfamily)